jgi:hypothetical protein
MDTTPIEKYLNGETLTSEKSKTKESPLGFSTDQPGHRELDSYGESLKANELKHAKCPPRHVSNLGLRSGKGWENAFHQVRAGLGKGSIFVLLGPRGTGKTQMAVEAIAEVISDHVEHHIENRGNQPLVYRPARYCTALELFSEIKATFQQGASKNESEVIKDFTTPKLVVFDEVTVRGETPWENNVFSHVVDKRYGLFKDTVIIGNFSATEIIATLGPSIASRLEETGGIIECSWSSFRGVKSPHLSVVERESALPILKRGIAA